MINTLQRIFTLDRVFLAAALGILLVMIGNGVNNNWLSVVGSFLFAVSLLSGGLFSKEEGVPIRVTMLAVSGLAVFSLMSSGSVIPFL